MSKEKAIYLLMKTAEFKEWGEDYSKAYIMAVMALRQLGGLAVGLEDRAKYNIGNEPVGLTLAANSIRASIKSLEDSADEMYESIMEGEEWE